MNNSRQFKKARFGSGLLLVAVLSWAALPDRSGSRMKPSSFDHALHASALAGSPDAAATRPSPDQQIRARASEAYGRLPLSFEMNDGQTESRVKFLSRGSGYNLFLTPTEAVMELQIAERGARNEHRGLSGSILDPRSSILDPPAASRKPEPTVLRMRLMGANPDPQVAGIDRLPGGSNYFIGNDPKKWRTNVAQYARVQYKDVYPGVDLVYHGNQRRLEYDFVVAPGADPTVIKLDFQGVREMRLDASGDLVLRLAGGEVRQPRPVVYQEVAGARQTVAGSFLIKGHREVGFDVAAYDVSKPLVIDPELVYSTYLGGGKDDIGVDIAVDAAGSAYVTGKTISTNFPTANPLRPALVGLSSDIFVTKLNPAGSALVYATYLGGSSGDVGWGIAVDTAGNAYVTGLTSSDNFPTRNPVQSALMGAAFDAFVTKLNPSGMELVYSTYLGGNGDDFGFAIAVDAGGNAHVTGSTASRNFPTANPLQPANGGFDELLGDAFVTKLNAAGSALVYSTYLGGSRDEGAFGIAVDGGGNALVTGFTNSPNFPLANALQPALGGGLMLGADAFVTKINPAGSALVYSTYLGGRGDDAGGGITVDRAGAAYLTGVTASNNFPTRDPLQPAFAGGTNFRIDAFVTKVEAAGTALSYSTYLGGSGDELGYGIAVDADGNAYVAGTTTSTDFPNRNPAQPAFGGAGPAHRSDAFVVKVNAAGGALVYATYLGGSGDDIGLRVALDGAGNAYLTGATASRNFPTRAPLQPAYGGQSRELGDVLIAKLSAESASNTVASVSAASFRGQTLASEAITAAFGAALATATSSATTTPLPTSLAGTTVKVRDSAGTERLAPLFFISPGQINYLIPMGTVAGTATVTIANRNASLASGAVQIAAVAPGLFAANANGQGVAAAVALRVKADGSRSFEPVARFDAAQNRFVAVPLDLGPETDQVFLLLFGTGIRFNSALTAVSARIGGAEAPVSFAGAQGDLVGLDQVNARVARSLIGRGDVDVVLMVDGVAANTVQVNVR